MKKSKFSDEQIVRILREAEEGKATVDDVARKHGITTTTSYRWKRSFGAGGVQIAAMVAERSHRYAKRSPGVVLEPSYFDALRARCVRRAHLPSFRTLLDALRAAGDAAP